MTVRAVAGSAIGVLVESAPATQSPPGGAQGKTRRSRLAGEAVAAAAATWPSFAVAGARFARFVTVRATTGADLARLRLADLYLACACLDGDSAAIAAFERYCFPGCERALARLGLPDSHIEEVEQRLRCKLFVTAGETPLVASYAGRGDIRAWARVAAVRTAIDLLRGERRQCPVEDPAALVTKLPLVDPELEYLKCHYLAEFKQALATALASLSCRQRNLLRYQHLDGLTLAEIATLHGVHLATVGRWAQATRATLRERTCAALADELAVSGAEVDSILRLIDSRLDVTLSRLLAPA